MINFEHIEKELEALNASKSAEAIAKNFYGLPTAVGNVTTECFRAMKNEGSEGSFYYHEGDLTPLGNVTTFT